MVTVRAAVATEEAVAPATVATAGDKVPLLVSPTINNSLQLTPYC